MIDQLSTWGIVAWNCVFGIYTLLFAEQTCGEHVSIVEHIVEGASPPISFFCLLGGAVLMIYKLYDEIKKHHFKNKSK